MTYTELFNPIYATRDGLPVIVVGFRDLDVLVIDDDGHFSYCSVSDLVADVRFRDGRWVDVSPGRPEVLDEEA
jgi:hypothetical protein